MKKAVTVILALSTLIAAYSCKQEEEKPKVKYMEPTEVKKPEKKDSSQIKVADLPVHMEGTKYLIHPVGDMRIYDNSAYKTYGSRMNDNVSYAISNYNRFELTGYFENLKFQHIDSTALYPLTDKQVQIQTATYLNTIAEITKKQLLVYTLVDSDTNQDGKIDANDIRSLYISDISGANFTKLSQDMQELIDWNIVEVQNRIYFRTIEDINKNGAFDKNDKVHYQFCNLIADEWVVESYEPVN